MVILQNYLVVINAAWVKQGIWIIIQQLIQMCQLYDFMKDRCQLLVAMLNYLDFVVRFVYLLLCQRRKTQLTEPPVCLWATLNLSCPRVSVSPLQIVDTINFTYENSSVFASLTIQ